MKNEEIYVCIIWYRFLWIMGGKAKEGKMIIIMVDFSFSMPIFLQNCFWMTLYIRRKWFALLYFSSLHTCLHKISSETGDVQVSNLQENIYKVFETDSNRNNTGFNLGTSKCSNYEDSRSFATIRNLLFHMLCSGSGLYDCELYKAGNGMNKYRLFDFLTFSYNIKYAKQWVCWFHYIYLH